ncbi:UNVERIFIED_CONTAM: hypothetical protein HDU68_008729, partial [Siphonaria sp. JEL0065]
MVGLRDSLSTVLGSFELPTAVETDVSISFCIFSWVLNKTTPKRPANIPATATTVSPQHYQDIIQFLIDSGYRTQISDKDARKPPSKDLMEIDDIGAAPTKPQKNLLDNDDDEIDEEFERAMDQYRLRIKIWSDAKKAQRDLKNATYNEEKSYNAWRDKMDDSLTALKSFFATVHWDAITTSAKYKESELLYNALEEIKEQYVTLKSSGKVVMNVV